MSSSERKRVVIIGSRFAGLTTVTTSSGEELAYDRLFIGTGPRLAFEKVPGLGPHDGHTQSVCNLDHALLARDEWDRFLETRVRS
jgi:sulfide:quinone oxidoreductase